MVTTGEAVLGGSGVATVEEKEEEEEEVGWRQNPEKRKHLERFFYSERKRKAKLLSNSGFFLFFTQTP